MLAAAAAAAAVARVVRRQQPLAMGLARRGFAVQGKNAVPQKGVQVKPFVYQDLFQAVNSVDVPYTKIGGSECVCLRARRMLRRSGRAHAQPGPPMLVALAST